ncbi:MAG TPA: hypothetical protein P5317_10950 [Myxococcota bacterium]|nr:hypothetical protein [Myxococcota bacterium]
MATKTVVVEFTTRAQVFPVGTVDTPYHIELLQNGAVVSSIDTTGGQGASFPLVPEGFGYLARVTKNGVSVEKAFDIPVTEATLQVPDVITVTF